jgi:hypothetical protein
MRFVHDSTKWKSVRMGVGKQAHNGIAWFSRVAGKARPTPFGCNNGSLFIEGCFTSAPIQFKQAKHCEE